MNESNISTNTQNITANRTDIDTIQTNVIQLDLSGYVQDDELEEIVNGLINQAELNQYQKKNLDTPIKIGDNTANTTTVEGAIGSLNTYAKSINTNLSTTTGNLSTLTDVVSEHTNSLSTLDAKIDDSVKTINSALDSKVSTSDFEDYQATINDSFGAVHDEFTDVKGDISTISETVNNHTSTLTNHGISITNNTNAITQNSLDISTNTGNINIIQSTIENTVQLDLSTYATKEELQNINLTNYYTIEQTDAAIKYAVDKVDVSDQLDNYAKKSDLSDYTTTEDLKKGYATKDDVKYIPKSTGSDSQLLG